MGTPLSSSGSRSRRTGAMDASRIGSADSEKGTTAEEDEVGVRVTVESKPRRTWVVRWWRSRISKPFMLIVRRSTEPKQLAMSAALGITLGIFPIYGVTVFLCALAVAALRSKCHAPTLMLTNFVATPLEIALLIPFLRLGEMVTHGGHILLSRDALWKAITGRASKDVLLSLLHALVGWAVAAPFIFGALYIIFLPIFTCMIKRFGATTDDVEIGLLGAEEEEA